MWLPEARMARFLGISSDLVRYVAIMQRHLGSGARLFLYTAGGMIVGTVFTVAASVLAKEAGFSGWRS
jgi:hypothetical protein